SSHLQLSPFKCPILDALWKHLIRNNLFHLCQMTGQFPLQCLSETGDLRSPPGNFEGMYKDDITIIATYEFLQQVFFFIKRDISYNTWDSVCGENLQNGFYQQIKELEKCMDAAKMQKGLMHFNKMAFYPLILEVKSYFQRMNDFLNNHQNSQCAWEIIRIEIKGCLISITQLLKKLK
uniref:Uncharacterized protein n=1 Tax=Salvator merianae TaxID=96440 RepID=A0A8D0E6R1_SALMN